MSFRKGGESFIVNACILCVYYNKKKHSGVRKISYGEKDIMESTV